MKKILSTTAFCIALGLGLFAQTTETLSGTFQGERKGAYYFMSDDGINQSFDNASESVLESYDLSTDEHIDKRFDVVYEISEEEDMEGTEVVTKTIIELYEADETEPNED